MLFWNNQEEKRSQKIKNELNNALSDVKIWHFVKIWLSLRRHTQDNQSQNS